MVITPNDLCKNTCFTNMLITWAPRNSQSWFVMHSSLNFMTKTKGYIPGLKNKQQKQTKIKNPQIQQILPEGSEAAAAILRKPCPRVRGRGSPPEKPKFFFKRRVYTKLYTSIWLWKFRPDQFLVKNGTGPEIENRVFSKTGLDWTGPNIAGPP